MREYPGLREEAGELWLTEDEQDNLQLKYRIKQIIFAEQSPIQHVMVLDSYDFGRMLVLDGVVQTTARDGFIYNEMISHVPLTVHPEPKHVLIIGGGDLGAAREVCRWPVEQVDLVEIDALVVTACREHLTDVSGGLDDPRLRHISADGVRYVQQQTDVYDVVIVDSSDPVGPAVELFQPTFYADIRRMLKPGGVMTCQSQSPIFHTDVTRRTYQAIDRLFQHSYLYTAVVPTYPAGLWSFTLGTDMAVKPDPKRLPSGTRYINQAILAGCFGLPAFLVQELAAVEQVE